MGNLILNIVCQDVLLLLKPYSLSNIKANRSHCRWTTLTRKFHVQFWRHFSVKDDVRVYIVNLAYIIQYSEHSSQIKIFSFGEIALSKSFKISEFKHFENGPFPALWPTEAYFSLLLPKGSGWQLSLQWFFFLSVTLQYLSHGTHGTEGRFISFESTVQNTS